PRSPLFPYTTLFRSRRVSPNSAAIAMLLTKPTASIAVVSALLESRALELDLMKLSGALRRRVPRVIVKGGHRALAGRRRVSTARSEEHTSELQSREN